MSSSLLTRLKLRTDGGEDEFRMERKEAGDPSPEETVGYERTKGIDFTVADLSLRIPESNIAHPFKRAFVADSGQVFFPPDFTEELIKFLESQRTTTS